MSMTPDLADGPFHAGEVAMHERLGIRERMQRIGSKVIRDHMPQQHQAFYSQLPFVLAGSVDAQRRPWASVLFGAPGFLRAQDARHLDIRSTPIPGDPLTQHLEPGADLGLLGIELHTRRRNRVNGHVTKVETDGFRIEVEQTVGNCPQYIQGRAFRWARGPEVVPTTAVEPLDRLDADARARILAADTLFVATHAGDGARAAAQGADVSHRGGRPGFVLVEDDHTLVVPEFRGNFFFMTLGNMEVHPRAGVLFVDFDTGDLLTLTGRTEILRDDGMHRLPAGAQTAWRLHVDDGWRLRDAIPLRWRFRDWAPTTLLTGTWGEAAVRSAPRDP